MPTLPMYEPGVRSAFGAFRAVSAPGGYEGWIFFARDAAADRCVTISLFTGSPFDLEYADAYESFRRLPTRIPPHLPMRAIDLDISVDCGTSNELRLRRRIAPKDFAATRDRLGVTFPGGSLLATDDGGAAINLKDAAAGIQLQFSPASAPATLPVVVSNDSPVPMIGKPGKAAAHTRHDQREWPSTSERVTGTLQLADKARRAFTGIGGREHRFGTGPLTEMADRWARGAAFIGDQVVHIDVLQQLSGNLPPVATMTTFGDANEPVTRTETVAVAGFTTGLRLPERVQIGAITLAQPSVLEASRTFVRLMFEASLSGAAGRAVIAVSQR